ncbi:MAG: hypothetical protein UT33_C0011G0123 [Candidatus Peregrinibacteria bacterium GW2011_GWC2_39_14]|nr:MAG: hypothetical protein UT33_C0011G0123 [Candidatus Peregrinibacteria bacterium GW2011_GWC2_39_14]
MLGTVHMLTGAVIGKVVEKPELIIPIAFLSHFVLDAIPHYDFKIKDYSKNGITRKNIGEILIVSIEPISGIILTVALAYQNPNLFYPIMLGATFASSPDILEFSIRKFKIKKLVALLNKNHGHAKNKYFGIAIQIIFCIVSSIILLA